MGGGVVARVESRQSREKSKAKPSGTSGAKIGKEIRQKRSREMMRLSRTTVGMMALLPQAVRWRSFPAKPTSSALMLLIKASLDALFI